MGEKRLISRHETPEIDELLQTAREAVITCDLGQASTLLQKVLDKRPNSPEIRIYLNNIKVLQSQSEKPVIHIVVSLLIEQSLSDLEILRGVAMAQKQNNNNQQSKHFLLVEIANDQENKNDGVIIQKLAQDFINESQIKAVIGHHSSDASLWAAPIYQRGKLVMLTPTSTATKISQEGNYIFQVVPNDENLASYFAKYIKEQWKIEKFLICYDGKSNYSKSFKGQFKKFFEETSTQSVKQHSFEAYEQSCLEKVMRYRPEPFISTIINQQIQGLLLLPSIDPDSISKAIKLVEEIKKNGWGLPLFGGDTFYSGDLLEKANNLSDLEDMILSVPWHPDSNREFAKQAKEMWKGNVTWRTFTAFDATQAVIEGFKNSQTISRQELQRNLSKPTFQFQGATGNVTFSQSGARQGKGCLVKISGSNLKQKGTPFQLIKCDDSLSDPN